MVDDYERQEISQWRLRELLQIEKDNQQLRADLTAVRKELELEKRWSDTVSRGKSPCGHWSAHAIVTDAEGKGTTIECLDCQLTAVRAQLEQKEQEIQSLLARVDKGTLPEGTGSTASTACGYQDVECWVRELHAAGWEAIAFRRGGPVVVPMGTTWRSPNGGLYRGPYGAWKVMRSEQ